MWVSHRKHALMIEQILARVVGWPSSLNGGGACSRMMIDSAQVEETLEVEV